MARQAQAALTVLDVTEGQLPITIYATNENHQFPADEDGLIALADLGAGSFSSSISVTIGGTAQTYNNTSASAGVFTFGSDDITFQNNGGTPTTNPTNTLGTLGTRWKAAVNTTTGAITVVDYDNTAGDSVVNMLITVTYKHPESAATATSVVSISLSIVEQGTGGGVLDLISTEQEFLQRADAANTGYLSINSLGYGSTTQLITNGTFATNTTGWTTSNSTISAVNGQLIIDSSTAQGRAQQNRTLVVGEIYTLSASIRSVSSNANAELSLLNGTAIWNSDGAASTTTTAYSGTALKRVFITFKATAVNVQVRLNNNNTTGTVAFDDVQLYQQESPIYNGNFAYSALDNEIDGWVKSSTGTAVVNTNTKTVTLTNTGTTDTPTLSQGFSVEANTLYTIRAKALALTGSTVDIRVGTTAGASNLADGTDITSTTFTDTQISFNSGSNTTVYVALKSLATGVGKGGSFKNITVGKAAILTINTSGTTGSLTIATSLDGAAFVTKSGQALNTNAGGIRGFSTGTDAPTTTGNFPAVGVWNGSTTTPKIYISPMNLGTGQSLAIKVTGSTSGEDVFTIHAVRPGFDGDAGDNGEFPIEVYIDATAATGLQDGTGTTPTLTARVIDTATGNAPATAITYQWKRTSTGANVATDTSDVVVTAGTAGAVNAVKAFIKVPASQVSSTDTFTCDVAVA